ncbi:MAG: hypothetical protein GF416_08565 [Candidatus Altiarchaeales archaeon]|nr:hypothetical protein [Candidatus Altiarchaeales archaeon]MBD3417168.1 hypothetical protein [Candidatus Altiarchaeales archaeon]
MPERRVYLIPEEKTGKDAVEVGEDGLKYFDQHRMVRLGKVPVGCELIGRTSEEIGEMKRRPGARVVVDAGDVREVYDAKVLPVQDDAIAFDLMTGKSREGFERMEEMTLNELSRFLHPNSDFLREWRYQHRVDHSVLRGLSRIFRNSRNWDGLNLGLARMTPEESLFMLAFMRRCREPPSVMSERVSYRVGGLDGPTVDRVLGVVGARNEYLGGEGREEVVLGVADDLQGPKVMGQRRVERDLDMLSSWWTRRRVRASGRLYLHYWALTKIAGPPNDKPVDRLLPALKDRNKDVRANVAAVLGFLEADEAIRALAHVVENDSEEHVRWSAADSLGAINNKDTIPPLLKAVDDDSPAVRNSVVTALRHKIETQELSGAAERQIDESLTARRPEEASGHVKKLIEETLTKLHKRKG